MALPLGDNGLPQPPFPPLRYAPALSQLHLFPSTRKLAQSNRLRSSRGFLELLRGNLSLADCFTHIKERKRWGCSGQNSEHSIRRNASNCSATPTPSVSVAVASNRVRGVNFGFTFFLKMNPSPIRCSPFTS